MRKSVIEFRVAEIGVYDLLQRCRNCRKWQISSSSHKGSNSTYGEIWYVDVGYNTGMLTRDHVYYGISLDGKVLWSNGGL